MQKHQEDSKRAPVLIIDDEPAHLKTIADILATEQLQPICCRNAKEALQVCKQQRVNVAILDLRLPDMDGLKLLKRLKQQNPDIKVIIHTGYASLESAVAAINEEAYAYVRKIGDVEELLAQVHRAFHAHLTLHSEKLEQAVQKRTAELSRANQKLKKEITQRKQAVDAQRMTQFAVDNAADFIYRIDADARIRYVNNAVCQALGFSRDELLSMSIPDIDPNYSFERWLDSWRELKQHNSISSESIHRRKDGSTFPVEISISYHQINGVEYSYAFVRDITERKRTEEALRQSEEKYRLVVENANEAIIVVQDGKMQFVNPKTLEITGYSEKELTTKPFIEFIYQDDRAMVAERHQKRLKGEQIPPVYSFRIIDKEGNLKWLEINAVLIEWEGKPGTLNFLNDISERKRTEEALRQSEEKYRTLFEESRDVVFISTPEGKLLDINPAGVELFGYSSKEELLQIDITQDLYANTRDRKTLQHALERHGHVKDFELFLRKKDGQKLIVLETATAVRDRNGTVTAYRGIIRDITERKSLEQQLLQAQKMEAIGTLAGGVAHDFNNLLTVILGNTEFGLQDSNPNHPVYPELIRIEKAAIQARDLTNQLLSFSHRQVFKPKILKLNETIKELLKMLKRIIGEDIELKVELALKLPLLWADPMQIQQVLMNLAANARGAMPQGGQLLIKTRNFVANPDMFSLAADQVQDLDKFKNNRRNYIELTMVDTGVGMDQETRARIFEPFFTTKEVGEGTGLGLAVVYGIVKQHEGFIQVESELGKGTTFKIYLPTISHAETIEQKKKKVESVPGGKETILIGEDDKAVRNVTVRILSGLGYKVLTAKNGWEALQVFKDKVDNVDLVLLDVVMPKSSGPETYKKLLTIKPDLPVIFTTGYDVHVETTELDIFKQASVTVLHKPYTKNTLGRKVREVLSSSNKHKSQKCSHAST